MTKILNNSSKFRKIIIFCNYLSTNVVIVDTAAETKDNFLIRIKPIAI